jgi:EmrB/QacA subfamily drug resistance transporter
MKQGRWVLAATILGSAMAFIDGTVINVALPVLQKSLGADVSQAQWIVDAYLLVLSSLMLAGGALGDRVGRVRVYAAGVAVFAAGSLWCAVSPNAMQLIIARAAQGLGAAMLVPGSLAIITASFPASTRGRAIGTWSAMTSLAIIAGPVLGGYLVQTISWRAVFYINLPIAAVTLLIVWRKLPALDKTASGAIDWAGTLLITIALGALTYSLIERVPIVSAIAAVALVAFIFVERRAADPIVPLALFRSRTFTGANVLTLLLYAALSAATFVLPFNLIQVQHYTPAEAGAAFLPFMVTMTLLSRWTGALADRIGPRILLIVGPILAGTGFALMARPGIGGSYWTTFFPGILTLGLGMSITVAPLTTAVMTSIDDEHHAGAASGINNTVARAAGLLAIALFGAIAVTIFSRTLDAQLRGFPPAIRDAMAKQSSKLAEAKPPAGVDPETRRKIELAIEESFLRAFRVTVLAAAGVAAASAAGALLMSGKHLKSSK